MSSIPSLRAASAASRRDPMLSFAVEDSARMVVDSLLG